MKTFIVTGAGSGLGRELALLFAEKGFEIILAGRLISRLQEVKEEIEASGGLAQTLVIDITEIASIPEKLKNALKEKQIYGLINNAGVGHFGPLTKMSDPDIIKMLQTNIYGTIFMTKAILPFLEKTGQGHVINIISTAGLRGKVNESVYAASKFAIRGFTESLQKEYEGQNIRFTAAYMGGMDTPFWKNSTHVADHSRFRSPREVAEYIVAHLENDEIIIESKKS
ncbi:short-chain dehydrogenase [Bacillus sp. FJAT-27225]|uniref:SDR family NAD(P)-dependent oxidoreductase n=1 Tax=Bacillus sp. FJAT-27225 TaxID=1743144 RepID=UPI00080C283D|nr:SDR family oxidoreductase [Bacillus sp. FJAT-27225]OCA83326.1 short-chain dehydrogenase [Bacillus sp. FJAT-27225]